MNIQEMHNVFRTLGQQMGLQRIRGILPESIDVYINNAIIEKVRNVVIANTGSDFKDKVTTQRNLISPDNALRTLFKSANFNITEEQKFDDYYHIILNINDVMLFTSFAVRYDSVEKMYKCRFIDPDKLEDILSDYCNGASYDYPIISLFANENNTEYVKLFINSKSKIPISLQVRYIETPAVVKWSNNLEECVNCNIPEYLHTEVVELAVNKFFQSVGSTTQSVSQ